MRDAVENSLCSPLVSSETTPFIFRYLVQTFPHFNIATTDMDLTTPHLCLEVSPYSVSFPPPQLPLSAIPAKVCLALGFEENEIRSPALPISLVTKNFPNNSTTAFKPLCTLTLTVTLTSINRAYESFQHSGIPSSDFPSQSSSFQNSSPSDWPPGIRFDVLAALPLQFKIFDPVLPAFVHDRTIVSLKTLLPDVIASHQKAVIAQSPLQKLQFTLGASITLTVRIRTFPCSSTNRASHPAAPLTPACLPASPDCSVPIKIPPLQKPCVVENLPLFSQPTGFHKDAISRLPSQSSIDSLKREQVNCIQNQKISTIANVVGISIPQDCPPRESSSLKSACSATLSPCSPDHIQEGGCDPFPPASVEQHTIPSVQCRLSQCKHYCSHRPHSSVSCNTIEGKLVSAVLPKESTDVCIDSGISSLNNGPTSEDGIMDESNALHDDCAAIAHPDVQQLNLIIPSPIEDSSERSDVYKTKTRALSPMSSVAREDCLRDQTALNRTASTSDSPIGLEKKIEKSSKTPETLLCREHSNNKIESEHVHLTDEKIHGIRNLNSLGSCTPEFVQDRTSDCNLDIQNNIDSLDSNGNGLIEEKSETFVVCCTDGISKQKSEVIDVFRTATRRNLHLQNSFVLRKGPTSAKSSLEGLNVDKESDAGDFQTDINFNGKERSRSDQFGQHTVDEQSFDEKGSDLFDVNELENKLQRGSEGADFSSDDLSRSEIREHFHSENIYHSDIQKPNDHDSDVYDQIETPEDNNSHSSPSRLEVCEESGFNKNSTSGSENNESLHKNVTDSTSQRWNVTRPTTNLKQEIPSKDTSCKDNCTGGECRMEHFQTGNDLTSRLSSASIDPNDHSEHSSFRVNSAGTEGKLNSNEVQKVNVSLSRKESDSTESMLDEDADVSDTSSEDYRLRNCSGDEVEDFDKDNEIEDDSSSDDDMTAGMVLAKRMREEFARKQQSRSTKSVSDCKEEKYISECSGIYSHAEDDDYMDNQDENNTEWRLLKSKSIKSLRRSKSKRRVVDTLPDLVRKRSGNQHLTFHSEGVHQEVPVLMDLPTRRRLTFWMIDGPCEDESDDEEDDSSCEENLHNRLRRSRRPRQRRKRNAAQLKSFVLFSCTKPGPPARVGAISPLQKTVMFPCIDEENPTIFAPADYINLAKPGSLNHLATEDSLGIMDSDLKFIDDPEYIEGEDEDFEDDADGYTSGEKGTSRGGRRLRREKIMRKTTSESTDLKMTDEKIIQCHPQKSDSMQGLELTPPNEFDKNNSACLASNGFDSSEEGTQFGNGIGTDVLTTIEENSYANNAVPMNDPDSSSSSPDDGGNAPGFNENTDKRIEDDQVFSSLSKRRRYVSRSCSGSSVEEWRNTEEGTKIFSKRDNLCRRTSYSDIVSCSIQDVVHRFRPNHSVLQETTPLKETDAHDDESDEERLFREAVSKQGGVTQKRLTKDELKIADLELDLENAERETTRMEDMLVRWVERLEGEKADILYKKQQLEEQLILQREKDEKDQMLQDNFFGGRNLPQCTKGEQNSEEVVQLRHELADERNKAEMLKRENERLLRVILCLKQELDSQMERQQRAVELEKTLKQTKDMLDCERQERHRLEKLIQDMDRGKTSRGSSSSPSNSPKKNRSGRPWWQ